MIYLTNWSLFPNFAYATTNYFLGHITLVSHLIVMRLRYLSFIFLYFKLPIIAAKLKSLLSNVAAPLLEACMHIFNLIHAPELSACLTKVSAL